MTPAARPFTSDYQRTNKDGRAVLYGFARHFMVYVAGERARPGFVGGLDRGFAAVRLAIAVIVMGSTVLLYREDGRA
jgi:hypothetical protein